MKDTPQVAIPVIRDSKGNFLLITRSEYPEHKNEWGPIAGHVKEKETIQEALIRESLEELALKVIPLKQVAVIPQDIGKDIGHWWFCDVLSGEIKPNHEIDNYKYFSSEEIKDLKLWPATRKFFENFIWSKTWNLKFSSLHSPDDILNLIENGQKTIETRSRNPNDGFNDYTNVKPGDTLHFISTDTDKEIEKIVTFNHIYDSIEEMLSIENPEEILPGIGSKENMLKQYETAKSKWGKKYKYELENYGIVALGFK